MKDHYHLRANQRRDPRRKIITGIDIDVLVKMLYQVSQTAQSDPDATTSSRAVLEMSHCFDEKRSYTS